MRALGQIARIVAGRWQIPLAIGAVVATSVTLMQLRPSQTRIDFDSVMADIKTLEQADAFFEATDAAAALLKLDPPLPRAQRAMVHDFLAGSVYQREIARNSPNLENARLILSHLRQAKSLGAARTTSSMLYAAQAHEWLGEIEPAIDSYRAVVRGDSTPDEARLSHKALVKLLEHRQGAESERQRSLMALLMDDGISPSYLWWAIRYALQEALDVGDTVKAKEILTRYGERLKRSDLKGYFDYLWAWVYFSEGRVAEAEPLVEWVESWLGNDRRRRADMGETAYLPALNRWLLGEIHLAEQRPQQALEAFEEVARLPNAWPVYVAATVGRGTALLQLNRDEAALAMYRKAVAHIGVRLSSSDLDADGTVFEPDYRIGMRGVARLRAGLVKLASERRSQECYREATEYLDLALELAEPGDTGQRRIIIESLADANVRAAEAEDPVAGDPERIRSYHQSAARLYEAAAVLAGFNESQVAAMLWAAAEQYDLAGQIRDSQRTLLRFVEGRSFDERYPGALLKLGQAYEADGELSQAIAWYQRVGDEFPDLREAAQARVLTAGCYLALGQNDRAETILNGLLDDNNIAPESPAFRAALRALCDLLYFQQRYTEGISRLEDLLAFYPDDSDRFRTRFMLGDSYRKSAIGLRDHSPKGGDPDQVKGLVRARLLRAAELYKELLEQIEQSPNPDASMRLYERLALFYRGDSLFDLNEPQTLQEARAVYQRAAARYAREPAALTAQVQLSNIFLRQGRVAEAARAIEHARWLLDSIPDRAFRPDDGGVDRAYWKNYLAIVSSSHLFSDVFDARP